MSGMMSSAWLVMWITRRPGGHLTLRARLKCPKIFRSTKLPASDQMTITAELANGMVYVLSAAWLHGEANHNAEEGTADLEFHGEEGGYQ